MRLKILLAAILTAFAASAQYYEDEAPFVNTGPAEQFIEFRAYATAGGAGITENYISCFPQINDLNVSMGSAWGAGADVQFAIRDFLSFGTELNLLVNNNSLDMAVTGTDFSSVSTIFLRNRYVTANIPMFVSVRFNIFRGVRWNVDLGSFYSFGLGGRQWQSIYDSRVNELGQLVMRVQKVKTGFYNNEDAFINSSRRGDIGLWLGTGLSFGPHVFVGFTAQFGFKNMSKTLGLVNPDIHNFNILSRIGYKF